LQRKGRLPGLATSGTEAALKHVPEAKREGAEKTRKKK
jgi:hypothetical protein